VSDTTPRTTCLESTFCSTWNKVLINQSDLRDKL